LLAAFALLGCGAALPGFGAPPGGTGPLEHENSQCGTDGALRRHGPVTPRRIRPNGPEILVGAADYHNHQFANLGFGGRVLWGDSYREEGIEKALSACGVQGVCLDDDRELAICELACGVSSKPESCRSACRGMTCKGAPPHGHYGLMDPVGAALQQGKGHDVSGYPDFKGWPHWNTYTHQQEYYRWLRRAFDGGLRLIVMLAVSNEILCDYLGHDHPCDDMSNVKLQFEAARALERQADKDENCTDVTDDDIRNGQHHHGWYQIAYSPADARRIIKSGAMAVVLGAEVDTLFGCKKNQPCSIETVERKTEEYRKNYGLTHVFPIHLFDNAFGGTAATNDYFNLGGVILNHDLIHVRDCSDGEPDDEKYEFQFNHVSKYGSELITAISNRFGMPYPSYPKYKAHCNDRGLAPEIGNAAIRAMMKNGMVIDVDHMSTFTRRDVLAMVDTCKYPGVVSGHSGFTDILKGQEKSEGQLTRKELALLLGNYGLLSPILSQGSTKDTKAYERERGTRVPNDCGDSAKTFAQAYLYAVDAARNYRWTETNGEEGVVGVGFGSDINGFAGLPAPRFGPFACGHDGAEQTGERVKYEPNPKLKPDVKPKLKLVYADKLYPNGDVRELDKLKAGTRVFDINYDGFANMGMFPDFVAELSAIGLNDEDLEPLFSSAEAYIQMWERAERWPHRPEAEARPEYGCPAPTPWPPP
jgi:microsomal dipeptidase-like Zn-dependent dipeptidase